MFPRSSFRLVSSLLPSLRLKSANRGTNRQKGPKPSWVGNWQIPEPPLGATALLVSILSRGNFHAGLGYRWPHRLPLGDWGLSFFLFGCKNALNYFNRIDYSVTFLSSTAMRLHSCGHSCSHIFESFFIFVKHTVQRLQKNSLNSLPFCFQMTLEQLLWKIELGAKKPTQKELQDLWYVRYDCKQEYQDTKAVF